VSRGKRKHPHAPYKAPESFEEYNALYLKNTEITGFGFDVTQHFPCPCCAAPDWLVVRLLDFQQDHIATCRVCKRTVQLQYDSTPGGSEMRAIQTGGDDLPGWFPTIIPRGVAR
jgi:hypothetical protein